MSRPLRIQYPNAWYHVMNRGRRGELIFQGRGDYLCFIDLLKETAEMWSLRVGAYCLMSSHYHLLIQTPDANLSRCSGILAVYIPSALIGPTSLTVNCCGADTNQFW